MENVRVRIKTPNFSSTPSSSLSSSHQAPLLPHDLLFFPLELLFFTLIEPFLSIPSSLASTAHTSFVLPSPRTLAATPCSITRLRGLETAPPFMPPRWLSPWNPNSFLDSRGDDWNGSVEVSCLLTKAFSLTLAHDGDGLIPRPNHGNESAKEEERDRRGHFICLSNQQSQTSNHSMHQQDRVGGGGGSVTVVGGMSNSFRGNDQVSKSQIGRKRKQPRSSSGPANSTGTANS
ncbi:hypothetical protein LR48_Vigan07g238300 [Vigna angularis]|uniref:Uncharacterized protein n=1 Tax=Phaseolus angularis TaxID=3914 RepID=A0A0L9V1P5_PHAAN|nr:hypothetical protein LR48_Vigan07g238300 [Vigna angularis]